MAFGRFGRMLLAALYAYLVVSLAADLLGRGVWPWLVIGVTAVAVAVATLVWGERVRDWWTVEVSYLHEFAIVTAASLCVIPLIVAVLLAPEPVLYVYKLLALGLVGGYVLVFVCNRIDGPERVRGIGTE